MKYNPNYQLHEIAGTSFLVEKNSLLDLDHVMVLQGIGLEIYKMIETCTHDELIDKLCEEYDAPRAVIEQDVASFLGSLKKNGIITD